MYKKIEMNVNDHAEAVSLEHVTRGDGSYCCGFVVRLYDDFLDFDTGLAAEGTTELSLKFENMDVLDSFMKQLNEAKKLAGW